MVTNCVDTYVIFITGTLSLASSAPTGPKRSPQRAEYNYEYADSKAQPAREQQQSASHYDSYIADVQTAASGGNTAKKGFSQGSGLRTIAVGSANQAKTALGKLVVDVENTRASSETVEENSNL